MFVPERKKLDSKLRKWEEISPEKKKEMKKLSFDEKQELFKKYIEESGIKETLEKINIKNKTSSETISLSQINRFYSLLEKRNFSFESNYLKKFVEGQIERDIGAEKGFYEVFKKTFLDGDYIHEKEKSAFLIESIKRYIRYYVGVKRLETK